MSPPAPLHLRITPTAEWKLRSGHPWLYGDSILDQDRAGQVGELAVIYDRHNNFLAIGLFDPDSPLRVRILVAGKPERIDEAWWRARFSATLQRREGLFDAQTTGYRLINGESDGWPGLVLDRYDSTLVVKLYTAAWMPRLAELTPLFLSATNAQRLVLRLSRNTQPLARKQFQLSDGQILHGPPVEASVIFLETGLRFEADVLRGQKTGFFLDQRENRRLVQSLSRGRRVLNAFSFSGGFSVYAARGGALTTIDLDISPHALESAKRNFALNRADHAVSKCQHETVQADAFEWLQESNRPEFDLVILDPPSLAKREAERSRAIQAYGQLARQAIASLPRGGVLVASSCSAHVSAPEFFEAIREATKKTGRSCEELQTTGHPTDHPAGIPEAKYLKCIFMRF